MFVWPLITTMEDDNCIWCHSLVRPRQEAIECDVCSKWQHRKCGNIGITRAAYRQMVKDRQVINWTCSECQQPNLPEEPMQTEEEDDSIHASFNVELPFDIPSDVEEENIADDSVYDDDEDVPAGPVINDKAVECNKPFYELLELLHTETTKVPLQVKLISEGKLKRCQRKKVRAVQGKIFALWEQYTTHSITTAELLKQTMRLNGPVPTPENTDQ